jgi:hypothetical protein
MTLRRRTTLLLAIATVGVAATIGAYLSSDSEVPVADATTTVASGIPQSASPPTVSVATPDSSSIASPIAPGAVARWIEDASSGDAGKRATAIAALATAPRADALPVLRRLLTDGEPEVDRRLALRSLRDLALNQGDADGRVRDAVRHAIYHGDDQTPADEAQDVLDVIEESERK